MVLKRPASVTFLFALALPTGVQLDLRDLRPTQFAVGMREVKEKEADIEDTKNLDRYLRGNAVPFVLGPGGERYVVDHHHLCVALLNEKYKFAYGDALYDWSNLTQAAFWDAMRAKGLVYLRDAKGRPRTVEELPEELEEMDDDPYRSLAYFARKKGAYRKTSVPFAEFQWAEFFRSRIDLGKGSKDFDRAVKKAVKLAHTAEAAGLPGFDP